MNFRNKGKDEENKKKNNERERAFRRMNSKRLEGGSSSLDTSMRRAWAVWIGPSERG